MKTGEPLKKKTEETYTDVFSDTLIELAKKNPKLVAVTAAMPEGTGLLKFSKLYPERFLMSVSQSSMR